MIFVFGLFSEVVVRSSIVELGDAAATTQNLLDTAGLFRLGFVTDLAMVAADVATAVLIYLLLAPVNRTVSLAAAAFRLIQSGVLGANLLNHLMAIQLLEGDGLLGGYTTEQRNSLVLQYYSRPTGSATSSPSSSSPSTSCYSVAHPPVPATCPAGSAGCSAPRPPAT